MKAKILVVTLAIAVAAFALPPVALAQSQVGASVAQQAITVDASGNVGIGTSTPGANLDVTSPGTFAFMRLTAQGSSILSADTTFSYGAGNPQLRFNIVDGDAQEMSLDQDGNLSITGKLGVGTSTPEEALHVVGPRLLIDNSASELGDFAVLNLRTSDGFWALTRNINNNFTIQNDGGIVGTLTPGGNLTITGTLTTTGTTCNNGCDQVFNPTYHLESIESHAAQMWQDSHLPAVGPTAEGQPLNLTEKVGGLLNELEKAHIYIDQLNERSKQKDAEIAGLSHQLDDQRRQTASLAERLARLEQAVQAAGAAK